MVRTRTDLICACRALRVVILGALRRLTPFFCSSARITTRNCGSVRMPVSVPMAGAFTPLRRPDVIRLSVAEGGMVPGLAPKTPGATSGNGPGKTPDGFAGEPEALGDPYEGAEPPCIPMLPPFMSVLPRNQS